MNVDEILNDEDKSVESSSISIVEENSTGQNNQHHENDYTKTMKNLALSRDDTNTEMSTDINADMKSQGENLAKWFSENIPDINIDQIATNFFKKCDAVDLNDPKMNYCAGAMLADSQYNGLNLSHSKDKAESSSGSDALLEAAKRNIAGGYAAAIKKREAEEKAKK